MLRAPCAGSSPTPPSNPSAHSSHRQLKYTTPDVVEHTGWGWGSDYVYGTPLPYPHTLRAAPMSGRPTFEPTEYLALRGDARDEALVG